MTQDKIIEGLSANRAIFEGLLVGVSEEEQKWKPNQNKWCLLEIVCHLYDEEREDFRARTKHILETPNEALPSIDPQSWVHDRNYITQNFDEMVINFLKEREESVNWLNSLISPNWNNIHNHPKFGPTTANLFLINWLAHDHLHMRQILRTKYLYLKEKSSESLDYAGEW